MKKIAKFVLITVLALAFTLSLTACNNDDGNKGSVAVSWTEISPNGTANVTTTTEITLTFDKDPASLTADNITVTSATLTALTGTGLTRTLTISAITVNEGQEITVAISNPDGFTITPSSRTVAVHREGAEVPAITGDLEIGVPQQIFDKTKFEITCNVSGWYVFYSFDKQIGNCDEAIDTWGQLWDAGEEDLLANDGYAGGDYNFYIVYYLEAGESYVLVATTYFMNEGYSNDFDGGNYKVIAEIFDVDFFGAYDEFDTKWSFLFSPYCPFAFWTWNGDNTEALLDFLEQKGYSIEESIRIDNLHISDIGHILVSFFGGEPDMLDGLSDDELCELLGEIFGGADPRVEATHIMAENILDNAELYILIYTYGNYNATIWFFVVE